MVRETCVAHILSMEEDYGVFFDGPGEFRRYCMEMAESCTWGDELTLRACSDSFQVRIHVVQSTAENWYLVYEPSEKFAAVTDEDVSVKEGHVKKKRIFVSYVSPVHYNAIVPVAV